MGIAGRSKKSPVLMVASYLLSIAAFCFIKNKNVYRQLFPIYLVGALIWDIAYIRCMENMDIFHVLLAYTNNIYDNMVAFEWYQN